MKKDRVKYHIPTDQVGYYFEGLCGFMKCFIFAEHEEDEVLSDRFCNFVDDKNDPKSFKSKDFIDLGVL